MLGFMRRWSVPTLAAALVSSIAASPAWAADPVVVVDPGASTTTTTTTSSPGAVTTTTTVVTSTRTVVMPAPAPVASPAPRVSTRPITWIGVSLGGVFTPFRPSGTLAPGERDNSNHIRACLGPGNQRFCSALRGFDVRVQLFNTDSAYDYPRFSGYLRTGFRAGQTGFDPGSGATSLAYGSVPLFLGGNVYAFKHFPLRPYAGLGLGVDVTRAQWTRAGNVPVMQTSVRPGFELHAGLEGRITNVVTLTAEVQQLWSARSRVADMPTFSTSGLTFMAGVAVSLPTPGSWNRWRQSQAQGRRRW